MHKNGLYRHIYTRLQFIDRAFERLEKRLLADRVDFEEHRLTAARRDARQMDLVAVGQKREREAHPIAAPTASVAAKSNSDSQNSISPYFCYVDIEF